MAGDGSGLEKDGDLNSPGRDGEREQTTGRSGRMGDAGGSSQAVFLGRVARTGCEHFSRRIPGSQNRIERADGCTGNRQGAGRRGGQRRMSLAPHLLPYPVPGRRMGEGGS